MKDIEARPAWAKLQASQIGQARPRPIWLAF
jgi:CelD/BcsL family acetyltransferase involved in cellulose biosynthesis